MTPLTCSKDNPPPKVISGYRFSIFYPDLIDKSKPPTYYIKPIPGDDETQLIVFTAGPPYEDIAFRIVKKPWEYSHRRGFRSVFSAGGVLQREWRGWGCANDSVLQLPASLLQE